MLPEHLTIQTMQTIPTSSVARLKSKVSGGLSFWLAIFALFFYQASALAQVSAAMCGPHGDGYGPYDYRGADPYKLGLVEGAHFTAPVEALIKGQSSTRAGPDLDYTLRAFPNHHRALLATVRYGEKYQTLNPPGMRYPVECWFERALRFRSDDHIVRMIYASFLGKQNRLADALDQLRLAESEAKNNPFTHYNIGLVYFDLKQYDKALVQAHRALELGFNRPELRDMLKNAGQWKEHSTSPNPAN